MIKDLISAPYCGICSKLDGGERDVLYRENMDVKLTILAVQDIYLIGMALYLASGYYVG